MLIKAWDAEYCCLNPNCKLYCYDVILDSFLNTGTTLAVLSTQEKTTVMKERFNKSAYYFKI